MATAPPASTSPVRHPVRAIDRALLVTIAVGAGGLAALWTLAITFRARHIFGSQALDVHEMQIGDARTPEFTEPFPAITSARYESVAITIDSPSQAARWLLWASDAASALAVIGICLTVLWLCLRTWQRRPFGRSITGAILTAAGLTVVGGIASQILAARARAEVVAQLGQEATGVGSTEQPGGYEGFVGYALGLDLAPLGVGAALAVVAVAFKIGERMQRDTEGLV